MGFPLQDALRYMMECNITLAPSRQNVQQTETRHAGTPVKHVCRCVFAGMTRAQQSPRPSELLMAKTMAIMQKDS